MSTNLSSSIRCTKCKSFVPAADFVTPEGIIKKTCQKHWKKRPLSDFYDDWTVFEDDLRQWAIQGPNIPRTIKVDKVFALDSLPILMIASRKNMQFDHDGCGELCNDLVLRILAAGGHRFYKTVRYENEEMGFFRASFCCCQDKSKQRESRGDNKRDTSSMARYDCNGKIEFRINLISRTCTLTMDHQHHKAYVDKSLNHDIIAFIDKNMMSTPNENFNLLSNSRIQGSDEVTQTQVYNRWHKANSKNW